MPLPLELLKAAISFGDEQYTIRVLSIDGKLMDAFNNLSGNGTLNYETGHLPAGIYLVSIYAGNQLMDHQKLVVIR